MLVQESLDEQASGDRGRSDGRRRLRRPMTSPRPSSHVNNVTIDHLKGRIAEALVESIFRRAEYQVARLGRESQVQRLVQIGRTEFSPDFLVWKPADKADPSLHRLLTIEVKYRSNLREFLRGEVDELVAEARDRWPELYYVLVTDKPEDGRSCFQVVAVRDYVAGKEAEAVDLQQLRELDIYPGNVRQHEGLVRELFGLLGAHGRDEERTS